MAFEVIAIDGAVERIDGADSYELEGPLTTFFSAEGAHARLSAWSVRLVSIRTDRIAAIRRVEDAQMSSANDETVLRAAS